jgi:hypothetical protein
MGMQIEDGQGNGRLAFVEKDGHLLTHAISDREVHDTSLNKGLAFNWVNVSYDYDAGDTILWLRNDSTKRPLVINKIVLWCDTATEVVIHFPEETVPAGTEVAGVNLNRTSGNTAEATAYSDETGNTQGAVGARYRLPAGIPAALDVEGAIILGKNGEIGIDFVTDGGACLAAINGYFHNGE